MNHATRTLYFTVLHLVSAGVQPIFVFDGPGKPAVKRGTKVYSSKQYNPDKALYTPAAREHDPQYIARLCKEFLDLLGLPWLVAPGEAEAQCSKLEEAGIVDGVVTEDGDAFIFGSRLVIRRLPAKSGVATVEVYRMKDLELAKPSLNRKYLLLLAMMSGGDYDEGIPGCGPVTASKVARAGYSVRLWDVSTRPNLLDSWRDSLVRELHKRGLSNVARAVPVGFPLQTIINYYKNPTTSTVDELNTLAGKIDWHKEIDFSGLREWTKTYFDWEYAFHAGKFVKTLALPAFTRQLLRHAGKKTDGSCLIISVHSERDNNKKDNQHGFTELRISYQPATIIDLDISKEKVNESHRSNMKHLFNPKEEQRVWISEWLIRQAAPTAFCQWQQKLASKAAGRKREADQTVDETPKRPRGRPPKVPISIGSATSPSQSDVRLSTLTGKQIVGRGRGRPRGILTPSHGDPGTMKPARSDSDSPTLNHRRPAVVSEVIDLTLD
ncbi:PIN domain-like protein [Xylariales sp. AK1849]|nr:PIN domain-like protein [Xylariales sp. AK1849]